ncbi:hypothetical protein ABZT43_16170 [Streptomyces sp. NPDC005349]|uniref:hypothetical protein n=1 Tax=Streptomyces sp. NPDC005349 TaxID=3157037 RepID=UPI0033B40B5A
MEVLGADGKIDVMTFHSRRSLPAGSTAAGAMPPGTGRSAAHTPSGSALSRGDRGAATVGNRVVSVLAVLDS